jgi:soluble lytic murein transglycosylase
MASIAIAASSCFGGSGSSSTATPSVTSGTPLPTATSTPPPPDPTLAADLRYRGEYEAAANVFAAIAATSQDDDRQAARAEQAELLIRAALPEQARAVLEAYALDAGPTFEGTTPQYMLASTLDDVGEPNRALDLYSRYALAGGILTPYANIERAKLLASLARPTDAEAVAAPLLTDPEVDGLSGSFAFSMARAYAAAGLDADALRWYGLVEPNGGDVASALASTGDIKKRVGDPSWSDDYLRAIAAYPSSAGAPALLAALDAAAVPVSDYVRGLVHYRAFENELARASLEAAALAGDNPGEALYYLGALDERADEDAAAIIRYESSLAANPASSLADSALWWRGRLLENAARYDEALLDYTQLANDFPDSDWAEGARFRRGLVQHKSDDHAAAAATWATLTDADGTEGLRARTWRGIALDAAADPQAADVLRDLVEDEKARGDYYAIRASEIAGTDDQLDLDREDIEPLKPDWDDIAASLTPATLTPVPTAMPVDPNSDPTWTEIAALDAAGLYGIADSKRSAILRSSASDRQTLLQITRHFFEEGDEGWAARAAATLISVLPHSAAPHPDLARLAYPPAYREMVLQAAEDQDIEPLLLFALMRQESLYDPDAGSIAGALGLLQIIPSTAASIATELGVGPFTPGDLFLPSLNIRFGAHYLASQFDLFEGETRHAVAAYNGGPGASLDARGLAGDDVDRFVEDLEFDETNLYVRRVYEHWWWYRQLYDD